MIVLGVIGVALMVLGPKVLGWATDVVFTGVMGMLLPQLAPGLSKDQAVELFRANGQGGFADMLARLDVVPPGQGIDFDQLGRILLLALALYLVSGIFSFVQGWVLNGGDPAHHLPNARRSAGEVEPASAVLLRQAAPPRRTAQPRHQ